MPEGIEGEPTGGAPEEPTEATPERTKESEIQANIEFWQDLGVEVDPEDVREKIEALPEVEAFDYYVFMPPTSGSLREVSERTISLISDGSFTINRNNHGGQRTEMGEGFRRTQESYAFAIRYQQEPDKDTLGENAKSAEDWEETGDAYLMPGERLIAGAQWYQREGTHLDEDFSTLCPGTRAEGGSVPYLFHDKADGLDRLLTVSPSKRYERLGVRRVVTKDTKTS